MKKRIYDLLLRSYDRTLNAREQRLLDAALRQSEEVRETAAQIGALRQSLLNPRTLTFEPWFSTRVMARLHESEAQRSIDVFFETLKTDFRALVLAALLIILGLMSYNALSNREPFLPAEITIEQALDPAFAYFQE